MVAMSPTKVISVKQLHFFWNPLSIGICRSQNVACFKQRLKTYIFEIGFYTFEQGLIFITMLLTI